MMKSKTITTPIKKSSEIVYDFVLDPKNLPKWAPNTFPSIKEMNGEWIVDTPDGQNKVMLTERNNFGILDHHVKLTSGVEVKAKYGTGRKKLLPAGKLFPQLV